MEPLHLPCRLDLEPFGENSTFGHGRSRHRIPVALPLGNIVFAGLVFCYDGLCCLVVSSSSRQVCGLGAQVETEAAAMEIAFALRDIKSGHLGGRVIGSSGTQPRDRYGSWSGVSEVLLRVGGVQSNHLGGRVVDSCGTRPQARRVKLRTLALIFLHV